MMRYLQHGAWGGRGGGGIRCRKKWVCVRVETQGRGAACALWVRAAMTHAVIPMMGILMAVASANGEY